MDPLALLKNAWRITWRTRQLWILTLLLFAVMVPELLMSGALSAYTVPVLLLPTANISGVEFLSVVPGWAWIPILSALFALLIVLTILTWGCQAAQIRVVVSAVEGETLSALDSMRLGRQRWVSIAKLSLTFGILIILLSVVVPVAGILLTNSESGLRMMVQALQTAQSPLTFVLGIVLMLVMMAVAVEDLRPRMAFRRAWVVFRTGWWGFIIVMIVNILVGGIVVLAITPIIVIWVIASLALTQALPYVLFAGIMVVMPILLFLVGFAMIFSTVFYSLTYREAARLAGPEPDVTQAGTAA